MKFFLQTVSLLAIGALFLASGVEARTRTGTLSGVVVSLDGKTVSGARVTLQASTGRGPQTRISDKNGHFHFRELPQGLYDLRAYARGVSSKWHHNILVRAGEDVEVQLRLQPTKKTKKR
jgi:Carboxypeptidase regulatory-like domain